MLMRILIARVLILALVCCSTAHLAQAATYALPAPQDGVLGQVRYMPAVYNENVGDITQRPWRSM